MRSRNVLLTVLLVLGLALLGWPKTEVPVPDNLGTSRDWTSPENAAMFVAVDGDDGTAVPRSSEIYNELGKSAQ
jgi:hypothetical protein